jgi:hypothetical protein
MSALEGYFSSYEEFQMRTLTLFALTMVFSAHAHAWTKAIDCHSGRLVIDRNEVNGSYQIVLRDGNIVSELRQNGAIEPIRINSSGEAIIPLHKNRGNPTELIGEDDAFRVGGIVYFVKPQGDAVAIEAFRTSQPTGGMYTVKERIGSWGASSCQRVGF